MSKIQSCRDLIVWKEAMNPIEMIYKATLNYPKTEIFGLTSQTRRAAVSIAANIAEGYGRSHRKEYLNHLSIAKGSLLEVETHLLIANRIGYITRETLLPIWELSQTVGKLLSALQKSLTIP
ncbi:MAG: four helix bundle protein [Ignavibacteria bacterium]|nr:four helix bundle protein [Ignavibacteria bacterium]